MESLQRRRYCSLVNVFCCYFENISFLLLSFNTSYCNLWPLLLTLSLCTDLQIAFTEQQTSAVPSQLKLQQTQIPQPLLIHDVHPDHLSSLQFVNIHLILGSGGNQNWTLHSQCHLTGVQQGEKVTSLILLASLLLTQPRTVFVFLTAKAHC